MALISCSECGGQLSTNASSCPHCGNPNDSLGGSGQNQISQESKSEIVEPLQFSKPETGFQNVRSVDKQKVEESIIHYWGLREATKSNGKGAKVFWLIGGVILLVLTFFITRNFDKSSRNETSSKNGRSSSPTIQSSEEKLQKIKAKHWSESVDALSNGIPISKDTLKRHIEELRSAIGHLPKDQKRFQEMNLAGREYMIEVSYRNGVSKVKMGDLVNKDPLRLSKTERSMLYQVVDEKLKVSNEMLTKTLKVTDWIKGLVAKEKLSIPNAEMRLLDLTLNNTRRINRLELEYCTSIIKLQRFLEMTFHEFEDGNIVFFTDEAVDEFNSLALNHGTAMKRYISFKPSSHQ
jgi:hypothetical protein